MILPRKAKKVGMGKTGRRSRGEAKAKQSGRETGKKEAAGSRPARATWCGLYQQTKVQDVLATSSRT